MPERQHENAAARPYDELVQQLNDAGVLSEIDSEGREFVLRFASGRTFRVTASEYGGFLLVKEITP